MNTPRKYKLVVFVWFSTLTDVYVSRCVACGRRIRWTLASCFDCNKTIIDDTWPKRFVAFS